MIEALKVHDLVKGEVKPRGTVVLVDRLWPRGIGKQDLAYDHWFKEVAPSPQLRTWWNHDPQRFVEFARRYRAELAESDSAELEQLRALADAGDLTLVFAAKDRQINHAVVLRDFLRE